MTDAGPPGLVGRAQVQRRVLSLPPAPPAPRGTCTPGPARHLRAAATLERLTRGSAQQIKRTGPGALRK